MKSTCPEYYVNVTLKIPYRLMARNEESNKRWKLKQEQSDWGQLEKARIKIASLESQITRLKALCGEVWEHMHPNSKDCDVCKALKQRLKDEGVVK